jgi:hypothetical protein
MHANRLPPTLAYSRSLNNNHLLSEAAGLYTAALMLPEHPSALSWKTIGWRWFNHGLKSQVASDGAYTQNSTNYHRLMLQLSLWVNILCVRHGQPLPESTLQKLAIATRWLLCLIDPQTGKVPNLGPNDGAYIFPLSTCPFHDYRPVLQAASLAFLGEQPFPSGSWDEMSYWLGIKGQETREKREIEQSTSNPLSPLHNNITPHVLRSPSGTSWVYLRIARFNSRPGHADQLHIDLWWRGLNLAQDPGTYLYNGRPPWDNALSGTEAHNTITIDGQDQMTRAGRFLWLDWAQAQLDVHSTEGGRVGDHIVAQHDGYRHLGVIHQRSVTIRDQRWIVEDLLLPASSRRSNRQHTCRLHWLLPDWPWEVEEGRSNAAFVIRLKSPLGWIYLSVRRTWENGLPSQSLNAQLVRAGELLCGSGMASPTRGWFSPNYSCKIPALSFSVNCTGYLPLGLVSEWKLPEDDIST